MKKVSRSDQQYSEVEKFKDYEVTHCIAYEMAKRNPEIKELLVKSEKYNIFKDFTGKWIDKLNQLDTQEKLDNLVRDFVKEVPERNTTFLLQQKIDKMIEEKSFFPISSLKNSELNDLTENTFLLEYLSRSSQRRQAKKSTVIDSDSIGFIFDDNGTAKTVSGSTVKYGKLFPEFSRPLPIISTKVSKEIDITLNLALPTTELTSLIEVIKKAYEKSNGDIFKVSTPLILASEIGKDIFTIRIKVKKKKSLTSLEMPEKSQQEVYADLLFLYDVFNDPSIEKKGEKIDHFRREMIEYYAKKVAVYHGIKNIDDVTEHIGTPRDQTVREYHKMMKSYIDDYGYKKLLV